MIPLEFTGYKRIFVYLPNIYKSPLGHQRLPVLPEDMKNIESFAVYSKTKLTTSPKPIKIRHFSTKIFKPVAIARHPLLLHTSRMLRFHACSVSASARGKSKCRGRSHANFSICACILQKLLNTSTFNVPKFEATMNSDKTGWNFACVCSRARPFLCHRSSDPLRWAHQETSDDAADGR